MIIFEVDNQRFQGIEFVDVIFIVCRELEERTSSQSVFHFAAYRADYFQIYT